MNKENKRIPWNKGRKGVYSKETIQKMSEARKGKVPWNKGVKDCFSKETIQKMSDSNKITNSGRKHSEESKRKIGASHKGKIVSLESRIKMSKSQKGRISGENNPNWKGGYSTKNIPLYDTFASQLTIEENPKRDKTDPNVLTILCTQSKCRKRFIPKLDSVSQRVRSLKGTQAGECRLYCSDECKDTCSIFNKSLYQKDHPKSDIKIYTPEEYQTFRYYVLERDNYECQFCGEKATEVHHERPQKLEPFFALDPYFGWSCCKKCHYEKGHKDYCSTGKLASKIC